MPQVVYEDDWLIVLDKPSGLLTIPTPKNEGRTLVSILNDRLKAQGVLYRLHPCHRLDRGTSGLIIFAKGKAAQRKMMDLFRRRQVKKTYIAFVHGHPGRESWRIEKPIDRLKAVTGYKVIEKKSNFSVIEAVPQTGRTNQIRIHFKSIGHPLVGEDKYAFRKDFTLRSKRLCLHSAGLEFRHPITGRQVSLKSPLPQELRIFLNDNV